MTTPVSAPMVNAQQCNWMMMHDHMLNGLICHLGQYFCLAAQVGLRARRGRAVEAVQEPGAAAARHTAVAGQCLIPWGRGERAGCPGGLAAGSGGGGCNRRPRHQVRRVVRPVALTRVCMISHLKALRECAFQQSRAMAWPEMGLGESGSHAFWVALVSRCLCCCKKWAHSGLRPSPHPQPL